MGLEMSREIKFRAWDTKDKEMIYKADHAYDCGAWYDVYIDVSCFGEILDDERYIVEQYTGLEDDNDKEIYEGDIISETSDLGEDFDYHFEYIVYWNEDNLCWSVKCIDGYSWHEDLWEINSSIKVIGNIHENPELLEK